MFCRRWLLIATALAVLPHAGQARVVAQQQSSSSADGQTPQPPEKPDVIGIPVQPTEGAVVASAPGLPEVKFPNFSTCPMAELQRSVRELAHLKPVQEQSSLDVLLDAIGAKTVEIALRTPNLISHETVVSELKGVRTLQNFSYLVLQHALGSNGRVLDEYRVDLKSGEKFQTDDIDRAAGSHAPGPSSSSLELPSLGQSLPRSESPPLSQGIVNDWLHFYPANRRESNFRYLGEQAMNGHHTLVVAFAEKPGAVRLPATIAFQDKTLPIYVQGIAWVDSSDFRIVRLRTDLLSVPAGVPLHQLTADIQFTEVRISEIASPLWLPRQVVVIADTGMMVRESHIYSHYRLFRAHSKILVNP